MSGLHPPAQGNGLDNEPYRTVAPPTTTITTTATSTTTNAAAPTIPTSTTTTTTSSGAVALEIGGYKVHPSALAPNTIINGSSSNSFTTGQLAATLAANDSLRNNNNEPNNSNTNDPSGRRNSSDSGPSKQPPKRNPPPPVPPTTTPYQAQHTGKGDVSNSSRNNNSNGLTAHQAASDTMPLLHSIQAGDQSTLFSRYQAMKQSTSLNNTHGQRHGQSQDIEAGYEAPVATLSISKKDGSPRWCDLCQIVKPDRCHHCKECDQCVLRMDHHCPWVNSCIGYNNLKFFYLFILYASLLAIWVIGTTVPILVIAYSRCDQNNFFLAWMQLDSAQHPPECVIDVQWAVITALSFFLTVFIMPLTAAHTHYILNNRTTIESLQDARSTFIRVQYRKVNPSSMYAPGVAPPRFNVVLVQPGESMWDRGSWNANWKGIMGPSWWLWFFDAYPRIDILDATTGDTVAGSSVVEWRRRMVQV
ncbi:palmitoyltransferase for Vac8p [Linnemannia gamsii]|uniref:Palmitoyltransferase n=1 Tax=Linnemannia gamsii TaxID=64522 RepID=A0ABQ7K3V6_9FUNG|nr:palmitoyltransferase for Vac8p [Linnemannia gamsii]